MRDGDETLPSMGSANYERCLKFSPVLCKGGRTIASIFHCPYLERSHSLCKVSKTIGISGRLSLQKQHLLLKTATSETEVVYAGNKWERMRNGRTGPA